MFDPDPMPVGQGNAKHHANRWDNEGGCRSGIAEPSESYADPRRGRAAVSAFGLPHLLLRSSDDDCHRLSSLEYPGTPLVIHHPNDVRIRRAFCKSIRSFGLRDHCSSGATRLCPPYAGCLCIEPQGPHSYISSVCTTPVLDHRFASATHTCILRDGMSHVDRPRRRSSRTADTFRRRRIPPVREHSCSQLRDYVHPAIFLPT